MSQYDILYADQVRDIIENGYSDEGENVRPRWADGSPAYTRSIISKTLKFDGIEVPILTTKKVAWKTAIFEILAFYVKRTNFVAYLKDNNVTIWDEWIREDGTLGKSYGYQLGKLLQSGEELIPLSDEEDSAYIKIPTYGNNQVHKLINDLKTNPASRRHIISLWNIDDLWDMPLYPCVWHNQWLVKQGKLHLIVGIRSNDVGLGQPFNVFQYHVLHRMVAQVTGYEMGTLTFNINDCHIYDRHIESLTGQITREPHPAPILEINPDIKNFDDFTIYDFNLKGYEFHPTIKMEVAV
jgi:thymidylate synthase